MIQDAQLTYSQDQAVTAAAASTNVLDHGAIRNLGVGRRMFIVIVCTLAMTDSGSDSTLAVTIETDDAAAFGSATTTRTLGTFAAASPAGTRIVAALAAGDINEQFSRLKYTPANGNLTTGSFTAFITDNPGETTQYNDAITIG